MYGAIKNDYGMFTMTLKTLSDGACAVVAGSLLHNLTVLLEEWEGMLVNS